MTDLASLGFAVDSSGLVRAKDAMQDIVPAAREADTSSAGLVKTINNTKSASDGLAASVSRAGQALGAQSANAARLANEQRNLQRSVGLTSNGFQNLSYQVNDVATGLLSGQSPFQIMAQQGGQVLQVLQGANGGVSGALSSIGTKLSGLFTVGRVAFGGIVAGTLAAVAATDAYLDSQQRVAISLTGMGRASGASPGSINLAASEGASTFGLSVSGARELASALAATGKVANDEFLPIIKMGHDFATTFGVDAADATRMLAEAFADPVKGAEDLNNRLGFLDAGMQRQIASLVAQNRLYDAQKVLLEGVQGSLAKSADVTSVWAQAWVAAKNAANNFFDRLGEGIANGLHLNDSLQQQAEALKKNIAAFDSGLGSIFGSSTDRANLVRQLDEITGKLEAQAKAANNVAAAQASLRVSNTVMGQLPEVSQRQSLSDQASVAGSVAEDPVMQRMLGITQQQADRVRAILTQVKTDFQTTFDSIQTNSKIALDAVTAFSPAAKALIASRQAVEQYRSMGGLDPAEKSKIANDAYNLSLKQSTVALSEQARTRELSAEHAVSSARMTLVKLPRKLAPKQPETKPSRDDQKEAA